MLIAMRKGAAGWVAKILFFLLILSFAVWGIGDYLTPESDPVVANVGEIEIRRSALDRAERGQLEQMRRILGQNFDARSLPEGAMRQAALEQLIGRAALDVEAQQMGVAIGDDAVARTIRETDSFQSAGAFDATLFRRTLFASGVSEDEYVASLRRELTRRQLGEAIAAKLPPPLPMAKALFRLENQTRGGAYARIPFETASPPEPSETDLKTYISENAADFQAPETRDVRAVFISPQAIADTLEVSEAEIRNRYEDTKAQYLQPERRDLVQALFQDMSEAAAFAASAPSDRAAFIEAAEAAGAFVTEIGAVQSEEVFPEALQQAAFTAEAGALKTPVETSLGQHVLLVDKITPETTTPFDDVKATVEAAIRLEVGENGITDKANSVEDVLAAGGDIEAAAKAAGLPVVDILSLARNGIANPPVTLPIPPSDRDFINAVFERPAGDQSGLIEIANGSAFVALIVDKITEAAPRPFEEVKADADLAWRASKRAEAAEAQAKTIADAALDLAAFQAAAEAAGLTVETIEKADRQTIATSGGLPVAVVEDFFAAEKNKAVVGRSGDAAIIALPTEIDIPTFDPNGAAEKAYLQALSDSLANDRTQAYAGLVRDAHPSDIATLPTLEQ